MIVPGREIKFLRTVWAVNEIAKICPQHNIGKFNDVLKNESTITVNDTWATFIISLNAGYEMAKHYEDKDYEPNPLTVDELYTIHEKDFTTLISEAMSAWFGDEVTVEVEPAKGKKNETKETSD